MYQLTTLVCEYHFNNISLSFYYINVIRSVESMHTVFELINIMIEYYLIFTCFPESILTLKYAICIPKKSTICISVSNYLILESIYDDLDWG